MNLPNEHKYLTQLTEFVSITNVVLARSRYDATKNQRIATMLQEYIDGNSDALHLLRIAKQCQWMKPEAFLTNVNNLVETNRSIWYAAHWLKK